ncbi:MAG: acyltransferase [Pseudoxanthomonas sp.]
MSANWKQRPEGGGRFAIWLIRGIARYGGRSVARACLYPITLYFLLVRGPERRASRTYLTRVLGRRVGLWAVAKHIHTFAATILDRVFLLGGRFGGFDVRITGLPELHEVLDRRQGVLLFGSHLGSFEVMRVLAQQRSDYKIRVVLDKAHNPAMTQLLDALNPEIAAGVIDAGQDGPSIAMAIKQATDEGALVALLVDRARAGEPALNAQFLGRQAPFPTAPWLIASALKVPVVLAFGLYLGGHRYHLAFESFSDSVAVPRQQRAQAVLSLIQRYAARLEHHARNAPYNWFNFYDFWGNEDEGSTPSTADAPRIVAIDHADADAAVQRRVAVRRSP